jgi:hypothetical protein
MAGKRTLAGPVLSEWTAQQLVEAFPFESAPRYLLRDGDAIYGGKVHQKLHAPGIEEVVTAPASPWQNAYPVRPASPEKSPKFRPSKGFITPICPRLREFWGRAGIFGKCPNLMEYHPETGSREQLPVKSITPLTRLFDYLIQQDEVFLIYRAFA